MSAGTGTGTGTLIHPASLVDPAAQLGVGVEVGPGTIVGPDVRIGDRTRIGANALLTGWTRIGTDCRIHHGAVLGSPPQDLKFKGGRTDLVIGDHTEIREYVTANLATQPEGATRVGSHCLLMAYAHVAHDCQLQDHVIVANAVQFAGFVTVEEWAIVGGGTVVHQFARVGCHAIIGGGSRVAQDVLPYVMTAGSPPRNAGINRIGLERRGFSKEAREGLDQAYRILLREGLTVAAAVEKIRAALGGLPDVEHFARFAETSVRGITR
jgi:UDP-N-acetylglucosamine acyltransferase